MKKLQILIAFIFCLSSTGLMSQSESAKKLYKQYGFKQAIPKYENMSKLEPEELANIANSYRLVGDTENAEIWYSQVVDQSVDPQHLLFYAQALQSNGKLEQAKEYYLRYDELIGEGADDRRGELLAHAIDRVRDFKNVGIQVTNVKELNTEALDFSPTYFNDGVIFVSSRGVSKVDKKDKWIDDNFMALFQSKKKDDGSLEDPEVFSLDLTTKFHEGPVTFSKSGHRIYFTRNHYNNGKRTNTKKGVMKQQIYSAAKRDDGWSDPTELDFNTKENEEVHPALSPDGEWLYFSSDRPGGFGGMDLYVVEKKGAFWGTPQNLGEQINTAGNEVFPFIHDDGTLYFASNGWGGIGGLDIFSSKKLGEEWTTAENLGTPFNSPKDDFGFIMNELATEGYFTSARDGGNGQDDIYSFQKGGKSLVSNKKKNTIRICTFKSEDDARIAGTSVTVHEVDESGNVSGLDDDFVMKLEETGVENEFILKLKKELDQYDGLTTPTYTTNDRGEFLMEIKPGTTYQFEATKNGYTVATETITFSKTDTEFCIPMSVSNCLTLAGRTVNEKYLDKAIPGAQVTLINLCSGNETTVRSDNDGNFNFPCLECDCDFVLKGTKTNFAPGVSQTTTLGEDCSSGGTLKTTILLAPADINDILFVNNKGGDSNDPGYKFENGKVVINKGPNARGKELKVGDVLELKNIYYDFDQYYIRNDAQDDLNQVVQLMQAYPTLIIELGSHTDSRASFSYNKTLAENRAKAAVDYIVKHGIPAHRIVAKGYGETQLRNKCRNGVKCSEEEHQNNRRTEVKILENHEENLRVEYINNAPETIDEAPMHLREDKDYKSYKRKRK